MLGDPSRIVQAEEENILQACEAPGSPEAIIKVQKGLILFHMGLGYHVDS